MDKYLENLEVFYDEKMKYLTKKDKFIKCEGCKDEKVFKEGKDKLILSCGEDKKNECGPQIIIELPKYIYYEKRIDELREELKNKYNWKTLQNFLDVTDELNDSEEKKERINGEIKKIEKMFFDTNIAFKEEEIQRFYNVRIKKSNRCKLIQKELKSEGQGNRGELKNEYITLVQEMNKEYEEIQELVKIMNPFLLEKEPEVSILYEKYKYKKVKKDKGSGIKKVQLIDRIKEAFVKNDGILTKKEYINVRGDYKTEWGIQLFKHLRVSKRNPDDPPNPADRWKKEEQEKYGPIIKDPGNKPTQIELSNTWREKWIKEFEIGSKVSWDRKGKKRYGIIKEIKGKGALIKDEKGKEQIKQFKDLLIED